METTIKINVDDYISEQDKINIAKDTFKEELRKGFLESQGEKRIENYERVINNAAYQFMHSEVDKVIGKDFRELLKNKVKTIFTKDLSYTVFRSPSLWGDKKSIAQEMLDELVIENREIAKQKVKEGFENLNMGDIEEYLIQDVIKEVIMEKLKQ